MWFDLAQITLMDAQLWVLKGYAVRFAHGINIELSKSCIGNDAAFYTHCFVLSVAYRYSHILKFFSFSIQKNYTDVGCIGPNNVN